MAPPPALALKHDELRAPFLGKRILVVEDDYFLATDICRGISDLGATVMGPAPTPFYALSLLGRRGVDAAILDIKLHGADVFDVADELLARNIPIVFATAFARDSLPPAYRDLAYLQKPIDASVLHAALTRAMAPPEPDVIKTVSAPREPAHDQLMRAVVRAMRLSSQSEV